MVGKDAVEGLVKLVPHLGHIEVAGMPGQNEPDRGMRDYTQIFQKLIYLNFGRWIGYEYQPAVKSRYGLGWRKDWVTCFPSVLMRCDRSHYDVISMLWCACLAVLIT